MSIQFVVHVIVHFLITSTLCISFVSFWIVKTLCCQLISFLPSWEQVIPLVSPLLTHPRSPSFPFYSLSLWFNLDSSTRNSIYLPLPIYLHTNLVDEEKISWDSWGYLPFLFLLGERERWRENGILVSKLDRRRELWLDTMSPSDPSIFQWMRDNG